jgi:hypothetical protein
MTDEIQTEQATRLLYRALQQLHRWSVKYGVHNPEWLPPAGDITLAEDIEEYIAKRSVPPTQPTRTNDEISHAVQRVMVSLTEHRFLLPQRNYDAIERAIRAELEGRQV